MVKVEPTRATTAEMVVTMVVAGSGSKMTARMMKEKKSRGMKGVVAWSSTNEGSGGTLEEARRKGSTPFCRYCG